MDGMTRTNTWANVVWDIIKHARKHEKMWRVRVFCSHPPRRLQQIAISYKWSCYNKLKNIMSSTSFHSTATMRYWKKKKKKTNATFGIVEKELVQVDILQIRGGDGAYV